MIKKGLKVKVLVGKDKNKEGEVIELDRSNFRAKVKGLNIIKKHVKTTKENKGGILTKKILSICQMLELLIIINKKKMRIRNDTTLKRNI